MFLCSDDLKKEVDSLKTERDREIDQSEAKGKEFEEQKNLKNM